jgi:hypothetical protein
LLFNAFARSAPYNSPELSPEMIIIADMTEIYPYAILVLTNSKILSELLFKYPYNDGGKLQIIRRSL